MATRFRPYAPDQDLLLPMSLREWLPQDHLAYFVSEVVEELELSAFYAPYEGDGRRKQPYEPSMMLKVLVYAYVSGVFSSRRIAAKLDEDVAFRVLAAGNFPSHRTICEFRRRHLGDFKALFVEVAQIARQAGLVSLGRVAVDGTKVRANASKHKAMSYGRLCEEERRLSEEIDALCEQARACDEHEDGVYGVDARGGELPEELGHRERRREAIRAAKARLEAERRGVDAARGRHRDDERRPPGGRGRCYKRDFGVPEDRAQSNFTDPQSRIMATSEGYQQCYNGQLAVDGDFQLIVANTLTANANDQGVMLGLVDALERDLQGRPDSVLADAGYRSEADLRALEARGIDACIALGREGRELGTTDARRYPATARMADKLDTPEGRQRYRERKHLGEAVNGWIKHIMGFRRFSLRGLRQAGGEWDLVCLAANVRRMRPLLAFE